MSFYRRWQRFKHRVASPTTQEATRTSSNNAPHEYLAIDEVGGPPLPRRNRTVSNVYPPLPANPSLMYNNDPQAFYADPERQTTSARLPRETLYSTRTQRSAEKVTNCASLLPSSQLETTPPAANARTFQAAAVLPSIAANLVGLPQHQPSVAPRSPGAIFPTGPIGEVMKQNR